MLILNAEDGTRTRARACGSCKDKHVRAITHVVQRGWKELTHVSKCLNVQKNNSVIKAAYRPASMHAHTHAHAHVLGWAGGRTCVRMRTHMHRCARARARTHTCTHARTRAHTHARTRTDMVCLKENIREDLAAEHAGVVLLCTAAGSHVAFNDGPLGLGSYLCRLLDGSIHL